MKEIDIHIRVEHYQLDELNTADGAYAPYSNFYVGAALRLANGIIVTGANQENAAFPSGLCAERTALFAAQANYPDQPVSTLAIVARNANGLLDEPVSPCGACRQVILGVEDRYKQPIRVLLYGKKGVYSLQSAKDLLPFSFVDDSMK